MKNGKALMTLAAEIERQSKTKRDFIAKTSAMTVYATDVEDTESNTSIRGLSLQLGDMGEFPILEIAHQQIGEHTGIPKVYYDKMRREAPALLADNVQEWFRRYPAARTVRTLDGNVRAFLSDKFSLDFDHFDFAQAVFPVLAERKLKVMSCELTERKIYVKAIDEQLYRDVPVGYKMGDGSHRIFDTVAPVVAFGNSEVGFGRMFCDVGIYTSACTNLAMFAKGGMRRHHVGARHALADGLAVEDLEMILSTATKRKTMDALWSQLRDVINAAFDAKVIEKRCEQLAVAAGAKITAKVEDVMEIVQERYGLMGGERESIFKYLVEGGSLTQYGLHAAVTRASADVESYDRATELEYLGGKIVELPRTEWAALAEA
jgi:hypothetical protein